MSALDDIAAWLLTPGPASALLVVPSWSGIRPSSALVWLEALQRATGALRVHRRLQVGDEARGLRQLWVYALTEGYPVLAGRTWSQAWLCREADEVWELEVRTRLLQSGSPCTIVDGALHGTVSQPRAGAHTSGACLQCGGVPGSCGAVECR